MPDTPRGDNDRRDIGDKKVAAGRPKAEAEGPDDAISPYDALLQTIPDAVLFIGLGGNVLEANPRAEHYFRFTRDHFPLLNIATLIPGFDAELLGSIQEGLDVESFAVVETPCVRSDGSEFPGEVVVSCFRGYEDRLLCFLVRDVTDRVAAQKDLEKMKALRAKDELLSRLIYELNNPLQILMSLAEKDGKKEYGTQLARIVDVLERLRAETPEQAVAEKVTSPNDGAKTDPALEKCNDKRLLVVDDEDMVRGLFVNTLSIGFPGIRVDAAANGRQAVDLFKEKKHGVIVMDLFMPVMDGEKAFAEIEKICAESGLQMPPVVFCTGYAMGDTLKQVAESDNYHSCLIKPVTGKTLVSAVFKPLRDVYGRTKEPTQGVGRLGSS